MAKTFNPNRVGGGSVSIVRAADGTYSLKETGFDQISSLNMIDLGAVATTILPVKTETATEKTGTTTEDQTKQAFLLPKQDGGDDQFTTEKMLKSATDVSKSLSDSVTQSSIANQEAQERAAGIGPKSTFSAIEEDSLENRTSIKDPTEAVFGTSVDNYQGFTDKTTPKVETAAEKTSKLTSANVQKGLVDPPGFTNPFKNFLGKKFQTEKGSEVTQAGKPGMLGDTGGSMNQMGSTMPANLGDTGRSMNQMSGAMPGMLDSTGKMGASNTLGISSDPTKTSVPFGTSVDNIQGFTDKKDFISVPAKKTFASSVNTALKGVGQVVQMMSPIMGVVQALGKQRNESAGAIALNKSKFNVVTSSGSMQGRIVGNDGSYDPANNLFHGMNRDSAFGNLEKAGQKRIDTINKTLERQAKKGKQSQILIDRKEKFERELEQHKQDLREAPVTGTTKPGESGGSEASGGKSIVCTAMYQTTGLQDWAKAMKIWYIYQKRYLTIQHQEGYHKLFRPFVKAMHKSNIIKAIGAHFAKHRTRHLKHIMFNSKPSLLGKIYNKILEPICYWAGKK